MQMFAAFGGSSHTQEPSRHIREAIINIKNT